MRRVFALGVPLFLLALLFTLPGCGSSGTTQLRLAQTSPSQGNVDLLVDGTDEGTVDYGGASSYFSISGGTRHIQVEPTGTASPFIDEEINFNSGTNSTIFVVGVTPNVTTLTLTDQNTTPNTGDFAVRIVNVAPAMGSADVYIVPTGTNISGVSATISSLVNQAASNYISLTAGNYQIYFTIPGSKFSLTTPISTSFTAGQVRTVAVFDATGGGYSTLTLADLD
jgi:Domain of unknown function (DUF4397)